MTYPIENIYIYNGELRLEVPVTDSAERSHSLQQHNYVKLVWKSAESTPIVSNAYIEYEGQVFYALDDYFPTHKDGIYEYDIEFHAIEDTFNRPLFFRHVDILDQATGETTSWKEIEWSLNGNLRTIAEIVVDSLNRAYDNAYFALPNDSYADTLLQSYSFASNSIADALSTIAEQNETEWWLETTTEYVDGKRKYILHFDKCELGDTIELNDNYTEDANGVWQSGGLKSVSQSGNTNIIPQKLYVYGSERNIIKKTVEKEVAGGVMNVSYDKKLRLPKRLANNTNLYYLESVGILLTINEDSSITISGINNKFEQVKIFDEVYPKMNMTVKGVSVQNPNSENPIYWLKGDRLKSIITENPADDSINPGKLGLLIEGCTLMCTFTSGLLNGREFECSWRESTAEIGLIPIDENDVQIPSGVFKPQDGDTFILWNLAMPQSSIDIAQKELFTEAVNYIEELVTSITETDCTTEAEATRISGLNTKIKVGQRISVNSNVFRNGRLSSRIIKYSYKLTKPYDVNFTLASSRQTGRLAALENMIADTTHEVHSVGQVQHAISRRQWHDTEEMMSMLDSIQKQLVVVGDENNSFTTTCNVAYNDTNKELFISKGYLQHQSYTDNEWKGAWLIEQDKRISMPALDEKGVTPFYVYFVCSKDNNTGYAEIGSALPQFNDNYVFVLGILSSEFEGERIFNQSSGLTSIAGGTITTDVIQDPGRRLIIDYSNATITARNGATIRGAIQFEKGEGENDLGTAIDNLLEGVNDAKTDAEQARERVETLEKGKNLCSYKKILDAGFTYASALRSDGSFLISHTPYANESYHNGNADIFGMEGQYLANTQYTICANVLETNATDGKCLYMRFTYSDGSIDWEGGTFNVGENVRTSKAGKTIQKIWGTYSTGSSTRLQVKLEVGNTPTTYSIPLEDEVYLANQTIAENKAYVNTLGTQLQNQIDGVVDSYFMEGEPTTSNKPASDWTTDALKQRHIGDTYTDISEVTLLGSWLFTQGWYNTSAGTIGSSTTSITTKDFLENKGGILYVPSGWQIGLYYFDANKAYKTMSWIFSNTKLNTTYPYYRVSFFKNSDPQPNITPSVADEQRLCVNPTAGQSWRWCNTTDEYGSGYHWHKIADNDAVKALQIASKAQDSADGKRRVFTSQPTPPYEVGDLWANAGTDNDLMRCQTAKTEGQSYSSSDWISASSALAKAKDAQEKANEANNEKYAQNLLSDSFMLSVSTNASQSKIGYLNVFSPSEIIADEKYTFSVESSSVSGSGTKPTFYNFGYYDYYSSVFYSIARLDISNSPQSVQFTMPIGERELEDMSFAIQFNEGKIATSLQHKLFGLMLVKGNKYYKWKPASQAEEESLYMMKDAMEGSTEIEGGLVMTNLIELKNQSGVVTAGISGLSSNKSFTEGGTSGTLDSSLRFWAGANLAGANTAPFRVYNDGRVFGTHFYGFHSAIELTASNFNSSDTQWLIDTRKYGSKILLNIASTTKTFTFPSGIEYVGSEIEIFNPYNLKIAVCGQNIISPTIATLDNAFDIITKTALPTNYAYIYQTTSAGLSGTAYNIPRWSLKNNTACSVPAKMPNYMRWKCICFQYASNSYTTYNVNSSTYYTRISKSTYVYFLPLWVLVEASNDVSFTLEFS